MTTQSWSAVLDNTTDAGFRAWGSDLSAKLALVGLVQTSDTGQINWATVTRPATAIAAGYEIWRFNDSLQGTYPLFLKIEYGSSDNSPIAPGTWMTVGTGTNGSGTLTGTVSSRLSAASGTSLALGSASTSYPSYFCHTEGFFGGTFRVGYTAMQYVFGYTVVRFSNDDGTPNGDGFTLRATTCTNPASINHVTVQAVRTASPATVFASNTGGYYGLWPHGTTGSSATATGALQVVPFWTRTPTFQQEFALCGYLDSECSQGTTFSADVKGGARTFIALGPGLGWGGSGATDGRHAMLWE